MKENTQGAEGYKETGKIYKLMAKDVKPRQSFDPERPKTFLTAEPTNHDEVDVCLNTRPCLHSCMELWEGLLSIGSTPPTSAKTLCAHSSQNLFGRFPFQA